jgi:hypothetical protein
MEIYNFSTNRFTVQTWWSDSTVQSVSIPAGGSMHCAGFVDSNSVPWNDGFTHSYVLVNDDVGGTMLHDIGSIQDDFMYGFEFTVVLTGLAMSLWAIRRGLRPTIGD